MSASSAPSASRLSLTTWIIVFLVVATSSPAHALQLLVVSQGTNQVLRYRVLPGGLSAQFLNAFDPVGLTSPTQFDSMLVTNGNVYVSNDAGGANAHVLRYDVKTGGFLGVFVPCSGCGAGGMASAQDMGIGPDQNFYLGSEANSNILRYDGLTGEFLNVFVSSGSGGLANTDGMEFGPDGKLYVSNESTNQILRYDGLTGAFGGVFVDRGPNEPISPDDLQFGPDGDLYVVSNGSTPDNRIAEILRYSAVDGTFIESFPIGPGKGSDGLTFGPDGTLYVTVFDSADPAGTSTVLRWDGQAFEDFLPGYRGGLNTPGYLAFVPEPSTLLLLALGLLMLSRAGHRLGSSSMG